MSDTTTASLLPDWPSVAVPPDADLPGIVTAAGGDADLFANPPGSLYHDGRLYVRGVTQDALDAALAGGPA